MVNEGKDGMQKTETQEKLREGERHAMLFTVILRMMKDGHMNAVAGISVAVV